MSLYRMSHYRAFGGGAPELFIGGPTFIGGNDQGVFYGTDQGFIDGAKNQGYSWVPATASMRTLASKKWAELSDPNVSEKDQAYKAAMQRKLETLLNSFYVAVGTHSILGYSGDATQQIIYVGDQLKAALRELTAYRVTPSTLQESTAASDTASRAADSAMSVNTSASSYPSTTSGGMPSMEGSSILPIALGIGAVALLAGVLLLRRRPAAVSGYRRRRRR